MKKAVAVLLVIIMSFTLFACSGGADDNGSSSEATKTAATTGKNIFESTTLPDETTTGDETVTVKEPEPMPTGDKVKEPTNEYGLPVDAEYLENLRKIFASGKYTLDMNMNVNFEGKKLYVPAVIYQSGKKSAMEFEIGLSTFMKGLDESASSVASALFSLAGITNMKAKVIYTGTKNYIVITSLKQYAELSDDEAADYLGGTYGGISLNDDAKYTGTSKIKVGGIQYVCEEFEAKDGEVRRFYFCGSELKRIEFEAGSQTTIIEVNSIKGTVDSSVFTIPTNYKKIDM